MRIGSSIALIAVGLILALAVNLDVDGVNLDLIGWILVVAGIVGLVVSLAVARRTRPVVEPRAEGYPPERDPRY